MRALAAALVLVLAGSAAAQPLPLGPAPGMRELAPLVHYAGVWDTDLSVRPHGGHPVKPHPKGVVTAEWVHGGHFLRQTWTETAGAGLPAMSGTTVLSYDRARKTYRRHAIDSTGAVTDSTGTWDPKTRTMVWTEPPAADGRVRVTNETHTPDGRMVWAIVDRDRTGKVLAEVDGVSVRRK